MGAFISGESRYPLSAPVLLLARGWARRACRTTAGHAGMCRNTDAATAPWAASGEHGHRGRKPKPRFVSRRAACHRPEGTDPKAPSGLHVVAQAHGRVEPIHKRARGSGLGAVGEQDGLCSRWTRTGGGIRVPAIGPKKTARRVRIVYAPGLRLRIANVYSAILELGPYSQTWRPKDSRL